MDILIYILELLKFRKEVGIAGLGTFYKEKTPGRYDAETHTFLPPNHTLSFSQTVKETNNLSAYIIKKRHISADTANYFIEQYVNEINAALAETGEYNFKNLGQLLLNEQELKFEPATDTTVGFDFFALPPVTTNISEIISEKPKEETNALTTQENETQNITVIEKTVEKEAIDKDPIVAEEAIENTDDESTPTLTETQEETATTLVKEPTLAATDQKEEESIIEENRLEEENPGGMVSIETPEQPGNELENLHAYLASARQQAEAITPVTTAQKTEKAAIFEEVVTETTIEQQEKKGISRFVKLILALLAITAVAVLLYFINPNIFGPFIKNDNKPGIKVPTAIKEDNKLKTQADSLSFADSIMNNAEKVGLKVDPARDTLKVTTTTKPINTTTYEVIAAALTTKEATPFIARLKKIGIAANIVEDMPGKLKKVSIGSFNHPDSAQKYAAQYRKKLKNPQIYAIPVKHK